MTNEQTAILLEGYWAELHCAIGECDIVNDGENHLVALKERLKKNIELLRNQPLSTFFPDEGN